MNKQKLLSMGVTEEQATQIMNELNGNFIPKSRFDEVNDLKKSYQEQLKQRDTQLEELKKNVGDSEQLKKQIETLQNDNKAKEDAFNAEIKKMKIDNAIDKALTEAKAKNLKAVKALLDTKNAELLEDGTIKGLSDTIKGLVENAETSFLFDSGSTQSTQNTNTQNQNKLSGFKPNEKKDGLPDMTASYQAKLIEARKNGNNLEAIQIKQQAYNEGIVLI